MVNSGEQSQSQADDKFNKPFVVFQVSNDIILCPLPLPLNRIQDKSINIPH